jgi:2-oxoglutarate dehydrogenase complex dehydrogenase (E1) component-like enzyme
LAQEEIKTDLSEFIAENFGANATYVETLLARWRSDPSLVDESWRTYFDELIGANGGAAPAKTPKAKKSEPPAVAGGPEPKREAIRGAALKIV